MDRRAFNRNITFGLATLATSTRAQRTTKIATIGVLSPVAPRSPPSPNHEAFRQSLLDLGYVEGKSIAFEFRSAEGKFELLLALATEFVRLKVDVIVTNGPGVNAAKQVTTTIPIVMAVSGDPVETGLISSLSHPGGNITGLTNIASGLNGKRLELLKQLVGSATRVAFLEYPAEPVRYKIELNEAQLAATPLGLKLLPFEVNEPNRFASAFASMRHERADALIVPVSTFFFVHRARITALALQYRIPAIYESRQFVEAGGLMSYGPSIIDMWRRAATYVDKILKGASPADLPVEQPTRFEYIINVKTADAQGLVVPKSLLQRADDVIK
jgi:putative ABC transport system substrate-binding protein